MSAVRLGERLKEAGLPDGVFNIVNGAKEAVDAILEHPGIKAVSFVGFHPVAEHVYKHGAAHGKRVQALAGAKNSMIMMPDAILKKAVPKHNLLGLRQCRREVPGRKRPRGRGRRRRPSGRGSKGGRAEHKGWSRQREEEGELTPVILDSHREKVRGYIDLGEEEGATVILDGRDLPLEKGFFMGPTILDHVSGEMRVAREEIFGPVLSVVRVGNFDEAIEFTKGSPFGNACSIYTENGAAIRH